MHRSDRSVQHRSTKIVVSETGIVRLGGVGMASSSHRRLICCRGTALVAEQRTLTLATFVAKRLPSMDPKDMVSCMAPNARPRCSAGYRSAMRLCAHGITRARPMPFAAEKKQACARLEDMETPMVHTDHRRAPAATTNVRSCVPPMTPLQNFQLSP